MRHWTTRDFSAGVAARHYHELFSSFNRGPSRGVALTKNPDGISFDYGPIHEVTHGRTHTTVPVIPSCRQRRLKSMHISRRTRLPVLTLTVVSTLLVAGFPGSAHASVKNPTTENVISATLKTLLKQKGVHVQVSSAAGGVKTTVSVDIGSGYGLEKIMSGDKTVSIIVTPTYAYLSGSKTGLVSIMGLTAAQQKTVGSHWVDMKAGSSPYESFQQNLTTTVLDHILPATKGTTLGTDTTSEKNFTLSWKTAATSAAAATTSVLTISSGKKTLPIAEKITSKSGEGSTLFSKWGEHVTERAPSSSSVIAYAKVLGS